MYEDFDDSVVNQRKLILDRRASIASVANMAESPLRSKYSSEVSRRRSAWTHQEVNAQLDLPLPVAPVTNA